MRERSINPAATYTYLMAVALTFTDRPIKVAGSPLYC